VFLQGSWNKILFFFTFTKYSLHILNSVILSAQFINGMLTEWCSYQHHQILEYFSHPIRSS
jgi:hypothetical protein